MKELDFSHNWNNKLDCECFTTLRMSDRFQAGEWLRCSLNGRSIGPHLVIDKKSIKAFALNEWICRIDTGYSLAETRRILNNMYKSRGGVGDEDTIYLYLLRKPTKQERSIFEQEEANKQTTLL